VTFASGSTGDIALPSLTDEHLIKLMLVDAANSNVNFVRLLLALSRPNSFGGGNTIAIIASVAGTSGTNVEIAIASVTHSFVEEGGVKYLRVGASKIGGTGNIVATAVIY
jgi:hypothetical protein